MVKTQTKTKPKASKVAKVQLTPGQGRLGVTSSAQQKRQALLQERWGTELAQLQNQEFASIDAAVEAIIDSVVLRIASSSRSEQEKARDFLRVLFESDPLLLEELRTLLRIR